MSKSTCSYPMPTDTCSVNDMVRVNLFTKLDDCKINESKVIYNKCGKDLECKLNDKIKNELKKCFKFEIDDKTKNELKENIMNELKKEKESETGAPNTDNPEAGEPNTDNYFYEDTAFSDHNYYGDLI